jgi:hypothetical protein
MKRTEKEIREKITQSLEIKRGKDQYFVYVEGEEVFALGEISNSTLYRMINRILSQSTEVAAMILSDVLKAVVKVGSEEKSIQTIQ